MSKSFRVKHISSISSDSADNESVALNVSYIPKEEKGIQFFGGKFTVRSANKTELRKQAYELLYEIYSKTGLAKRNSNGLWLSIFDALPETTTLVAENENGNIEGALTLVFDSPIGLPADELYKNEVDKVRNGGGKICEFISLGTNYKAKSPHKILAGLFYCAFLHAWQKKKSSDLVITVHPRYEKFYCRKLSFERIGPERNYTKVNGALAVLLNLSLEEINRLRNEQRVFPFSMLDFSNQEELEIANRIENMVCPISDEDFFTFFIEKSDAWEKASPQQKNFIKKLYPAHEVNHAGVSRALAKAFSKKIHYPDDTPKPTARIAKS